MTTPMSDERLAEIRREYEDSPTTEVADLLAEVERLRATNARYIARIETLARENRVLHTRATVCGEQRDTASEQVKRLRAERERAVDALSDVGRTAEAASGDLEDGINAELLALSRTVGEAEVAVQRVRECVASMSWEHAMVKARDIRRALDGAEAGR